jgi:lipoate-protein ligase A
VLVAPGSQLWLDVFVPAGDRLFTADVGKAFHWLGDAIAAAITRATGETVAVHKGALKTTPWSKMLCFAGIGPGEALVHGRKVLGLAQRRNRYGAWLHAMVPYELDTNMMAALLALDADERRAAVGSLDHGAMALPEAADDLTALVVDQLARCP